MPINPVFLDFLIFKITENLLQRTLSCPSLSEHVQNLMGVRVASQAVLVEPSLLYRYLEGLMASHRMELGCLLNLTIQRLLIIRDLSIIVEQVRNLFCRT